eukprot:TRINITY_DN4736_c0_g1_i1.p1 TRINITY_DN4736_c0_g1~~TRINITY_DN4736_c0_g1_i1.p1  ORF type:complete len:281 (+),score=58.49 TRINITY_DN4736_c0_g1_i1:42-884(+)
MATERCDACFLTIDNASVSAMGQKFHKDCFVCTSCKKPFPNGEFVTKQKPGATSTSPPFPYCVKCVQGLCASCNNFCDEFFELDNKKYHPNCFKCFGCKSPLTSGEFYNLEGKPFCEVCQKKKAESQGPPSSGPRASISSSCNQFAPLEVCESCRKSLNEGQSLVVGTRKWHQKCFKCKTCDSVIKVDEKFYDYKLAKYNESAFICEPCMGQLCSRCNNVITPQEKFVTYQKDKLHFDCFSCWECGKKLEVHAFHELEGKPYCEIHFKFFNYYHTHPKKK